MVRTRAGELRHTVTIQSATTAADAAGQMIETWATLYAGVPMGIVEQRGSEGRDGKQITATGSLLMKLRWMAGLDVLQRIVWDGRTFGILSIDDPDGTRNHVICAVREVRT